MKRADNGDDEQSQETVEPPHALSRSEIAPAHELANRLVEELRDLPDGDLVGEIVANAMKLLRDQTNRGDIKLINKSFKELRYALKIFAPYRDVRKVSIFGSARTAETDRDYIQAADFAKQMVSLGWMVITGAGGGIMAAGHGGAGAEPSFGLAIRLPFEQKTNPFIANDPKLINFKYFFTRKLMFVRSSHAITVFPGGFGTMDEGFEVLTLVQTGKSVPMPIVLVEATGGDYWKPWQQYVQDHLVSRGLVGADDLRLYRITDSNEAAIEEIRRFYSNYHSLRHTRDDVIIRLHYPLTEAELSEIEAKFSDLLMPPAAPRGNGNALMSAVGAVPKRIPPTTATAARRFRSSGALAVEHDEPALASLPRLVFPFNRRDHGRLRILIDHLNDLHPNRKE